MRIVASDPGVTLFAATVTPDGNYVDFVKGPFPNTPAWRVGFLGGTPKRLPIEGRVGSPIGWSPDGRRMAYLGNSTAVVVADADANGPRRYELSDLVYSFSEGAWPATPSSWSPDGRLIAMRGRKLSAADQTVIDHVAIVDVSTGSVQALPLAFRGAGGLAWLGATSLGLNQDGQLWNRRWRADGAQPGVRAWRGARCVARQQVRRVRPRSQPRSRLQPARVHGPPPVQHPTAVQGPGPVAA